MEKRREMEEDGGRIGRRYGEDGERIGDIRR